jgi:hypothetical protein
MDEHDIIHAAIPAVIDSTMLSSALFNLKTSILTDEMRCSICLETYTDPHVLPECMHRFCKVCIKKSLRKCGNECPICRTRVTTSRDLRRDEQTQNVVRSRSSPFELLYILTAFLFLIYSYLWFVRNSYLS